MNMGTKDRVRSLEKRGVVSNSGGICLLYHKLEMDWRAMEWNGKSQCIDVCVCMRVEGKRGKRDSFVYGRADVIKG